MDEDATTPETETPYDPYAELADTATDRLAHIDRRTIGIDRKLDETFLALRGIDAQLIALTVAATMCVVMIWLLSREVKGMQ